MAEKRLNIRLGFIFDEKSLGALSAKLKRSGRDFSSAGNRISTGFSLPVVDMGAAAIKSAGDIEALTLALKSQLGSSEAAATELAALTEAAKNPGLGLEQAVRGSVRLQGVGFSAEQARESLVQMGNAIASTGGTAQELDAVTRQFAQMAAKGRVLQDDVTILSENMPALSGLMQKTFGTTNVEAIREMGVSGKDFVLAMTEAAKTLPRVEGGIQNSIGNALDSLKQSAAKVGTAINNAFDVTGAIETLSSGVVLLADGFAALPSPVQSTALGLVALAAATGPVLKVWGSLKTLRAQAITGWAGLVGGVKSATAAFTGLSTAMKVTVVGAAIAGVVALYQAYDHFSNSLSAAERAQRSVQDVSDRAAESIAAQKSEVDTIVSIYKQEGTTLARKKELLAQLNKISPEYFGQIKVGKGDIEALTVATANYSAELLKVAKVTAAKDRLVEIEKELLNVSKAADPTVWQTLGNAFLTGGRGAAFYGLQAKTMAGNIAESKDALAKEQEELVKIISSTEVAAVKTKDFGDATGDLSDKAKTLKEVLKDVAYATTTGAFFGDDSESRADALVKGIEKLIEVGFKPASKEVQGLKAQLDALFPQIEGVTDSLAPSLDPIELVATRRIESVEAPAPVAPPQTVEAEIGNLQAVTDYIALAQQGYEVTTQFTEGILGFGAAMEAAMEAVRLNGTATQEVFLAMGGAISDAALSGASSLRELGEAALAAAAKTVRAFIQQGVAAAVARALSSLPFPANLVAGAAAGGLAAALFTKVISSIGVPKFARGTLDAGGGLSLVGERGPELVNLPRHSQVFPANHTSELLNQMGQQQTIVVGGQIKFDGRDLYLLLQQQDDQQGRATGRKLFGLQIR